MTQIEKIEKIENLFDQMKDLFPGKTFILFVHSIDMSDIPDNFIVRENISDLTKTPYKSAKNEDRDITLFD
jgi:hypothetical protein